MLSIAAAISSSDAEALTSAYVICVLLRYLG
jgi:hypothetical protein